MKKIKVLVKLWNMGSSEKSKIEVIKHGKILEEFFKKCENQKKIILKDLVDKLRLSERFVKTQKF